MIAVKEMKMPNSCSECNLATRKTWNYACSINLKDIDCTETKRPKDCPLVEVDTCEDAISRKSMLDYLKYLHGEMSEEEFIKELPSVTPARKKGKWINKSHKNSCGITFAISECTCCGKNTFFDCDELLYRYCPNCGAKMDEVNKPKGE